MTVNSINITFDAMDRMVELNNSGSYTQILYNPQGQTFAFASNQAASYVNMRLPGGTMAVENGNGPWLYRHGDWLGSVRLVSLPSGSSRVWYDGAFGPYGENYAEQGEIDRTFTGQGQAVVNSGSYPLYDFLKREYHPVWGRWVRPDPAGLGAVSPANPQSWNRYAYVTNNPLALTDPTGLSAITDVCQWHPQSYLSPCATFSYGGGYPGENCSLDGGPIGCGIAYGLAAIGAAVECPYDDCSPVNDNGALKEFYAFADGSSGYYLANQAPQQSTLAAELLWISQLVSWNNSSGLPDAVIIAIIWKESGFNLLAFNGAGGGFGAIGLMQIREIGLTDFNQTWWPSGGYDQGDLWDPILNVYIGSALVYNFVFRYNSGNVTAGLNMYGTGAGYGQSILGIAANIPTQGIGALH